MVVALTWYAVPRPKAAQASGGAAPAAADVAPLIKVEPIVVNMADEEETHYLKCSLELEANNAKDAELINSRMALVRNELILFLSSHTSDSLRGEKPKAELLAKVMTRLNKALGQELVRRVFFTELVIQ